jgi:hypothetical protein
MKIEQKEQKRDRCSLFTQTNKRTRKEECSRKEVGIHRPGMDTERGKMKQKKWEK